MSHPGALPHLLRARDVKVADFRLDVSGGHLAERQAREQDKGEPSALQAIHHRFMTRLEVHC